MVSADPPRGEDPVRGPTGAALDPGRGVSRAAAAGEAAGRAATSRYYAAPPAIYIRQIS